MNILAKRWNKKRMPKRILAIRLQAMGDVIITLPYLQALKDTLPPGATLDLLTREEVNSIPKALALFNKVYSIGGGRDFKKQFIYALLLLPKLLFRRYEIIIDLQNNKISRMLRKLLFPLAWSEFDRFSPISAGERNKQTITAIGLNIDFSDNAIQLKQRFSINKLLIENGWDGNSNLVILNPAGAFSTRNWPLDNYITFANCWLKKFPKTQFVTVGIPFINEKAIYLKRQLGNKLINLVSKTTAVEALAIVKQSQLVLSEDSGLMHMAWVSKIPTLVIFGSTRSDWSAPIGKHTLLLSSNDLPCGNCMLETCKYGDTHCLTRYSPQFVFDKALDLLQYLQ